MASNGAKDAVLVGGVTEDGAVVVLQLMIQFANKLEVGELRHVLVQILTSMFDIPILIDGVVRELKGHLLVGLHAIVIRQGNGCGFEVNHVERVLPRCHFCAQTVYIQIDVAIQMLFESA